MCLALGSLLSSLLSSLLAALLLALADSLGLGDRGLLGSVWDALVLLAKGRKLRSDRLDLGFGRICTLGSMQARGRSRMACCSARLRREGFVQQRPAFRGGGRNHAE